MAARRLFSTTSPLATARSGTAMVRVVVLVEAPDAVLVEPPAVLLVEPVEAVELVLGSAAEVVAVLGSVVEVSASAQPGTKGARLAMANQRPVWRRKVLRSMPLMRESLPELGRDSVSRPSVATLHVSPAHLCSVSDLTQARGCRRRVRARRGLPCWRSRTMPA